MKKPALLVLFIGCVCSCTTAFSQNLLSSSKLSWELVPAGFLEPRLEGEIGLDALAERFSDEELALATNDKDCFALAYVLLVKKKGLERSIPAKKAINEVEASFMDLRVRVRYKRDRNGFEKTVDYPNSARQQQRVINAAQRLIGVASKRDPNADPKESWRDYDKVAVVTESLTPVVEFVSMSPRVVVEGKPIWKTIAGKETLVRSIGKRNDWKGVHVLLTETFYPDSQQIDSTSTGFDVNCNGLTVRVTRNGDKWDVSFPCEENERASLAEFWSLRFQGDNRTW
jgi:hypothetical protein